MGFWKNTALLAAGALAGYLASHRQSSEPDDRIEIRRESALASLARGDAMAKFFDSAIGRPLQPYALQAVRFAARVKNGMDEKETELHQRFEMQKRDIRPGSIDTWGNGSYPDRGQAGVENGSVEDGSASVSGSLRRRIDRDRTLGSDFFS